MGFYAKVFYDGFQITPEIVFGTACVSSRGGSYCDGFEITPTIVMGTSRVSYRGGVYFPGFLVTPTIYMGSYYSQTATKMFYSATEIWIYAEPSNSTSIVTKAAIDPVTGAYTKTFQPAFLLVVGKLLDFTATPRWGRAELSVQFTDISSPMVTNWYWNFGDGSFSIEQHPTHVYKTPGVYTVRLLVKIAVTWYPVHKANYIVVWPGGLKVSETNKCYRYAIKPEQGRSWSELGGAGWVFPESRVGLFKFLLIQISLYY